MNDDDGANDDSIDVGSFVGIFVGMKEALIGCTVSGPGVGSIIEGNSVEYFVADGDHEGTYCEGR